MIRSVRLRAALAAAAVLLAACGGGGGDADSVKTDSVKTDDTPLAGRDCRQAAGDSAQAVCKALNEVERRGGPARVFGFVRHGDTICVHTGPAPRGNGPVGTDGEGAVEVVGGRVVSSVLSDSTGCRGE